jgi:UDP-GlcNAc:undecaprenyl-phosphate GlcNAc-1-phosphate transferase
VASLGASLVAPIRRAGNLPRQASVRLQGTREWDLLWCSLTESADKLHIIELELDVNLPMMHEGYFASWRRKSSSSPERVWRMAIPLLVGGSPAGRLNIVGDRLAGSFADDLEALMDLLEPFELNLAELAEPTLIDVRPSAIVERAPPVPVTVRT